MNRKAISALISFAMCIGMVEGVPLERASAATDITVSEGQTLNVSPDLTSSTTSSAISQTTGSGIVAQYSFDSADGTKIVDTSGNGNDATLMGGATLADGKEGKAISLNGTDAYVKLPEGILRNLTDVTITAWVKVDKEQDYQRIFDFGNDTTTYMYLLSSGRNANATGLAAGITTGGWSKEQTLQKGTDLEVGVWKHIAFVISGNTATIYENGQKVAENTNLTLNPSSLGNTTNNYIGKSQFGDAPFAGQIDSFCIYGRALSDGEIAGMVNLSGDDIVKGDKDSINLGDITAVTGDLVLPTTGSLGSTISWKSSNESIISNTGKVTCPTLGQVDATVKLTATITKDGVTDTREFDVTVKAQLSDEECVKEDKDAIYIGNIYTVDANLQLPATGENGSNITWASDNTDIITNDGKVTRPAAGSPNAKVKLTATVTKGSAKDTREFDVTVVAMPKVIKVASIPEVNAETSIGIAPDLPNVILVTNDDNSTGVGFVTWSNIDASEYASEGTFKVEGTVQGTNIKAVANVKVNKFAISTKFNMTKLQPNQTLVADVSTTNSSIEAGQELVIVGLFDKNEAMKSVSYISKEIKPGSSENLDAGFKLPSNVDGYKVRAFVWNGTSLEDTNMNPLSKTNELSAETTTSASISANSFDLGKVNLEASEFTKNRDSMYQYLLSVNDDSMLYNFRSAAGLDLKDAQPLIGWDDPTCLLRGHTTGHYLSALAQAYASSGDVKFKNKMDYMVSELGKCQEALSAKYGEGFLSGYSSDQFKLLEKYTTYPTIWAPYYTLHKIMAGLVDCYQVGGNTQALDIAKGMGTWVYNELSPLPKAQLQKMWSMYIAGEFGGMNEVLAKLYGITGDEKYLTAAKYFDNPKLFVPMANNIDTLGGMHANQHIPQIIGALQIYDETNDSNYYNIANNFWNIVTGHHIFSIGGTGQGEMFKDADKIAAYIDPNDAESCASYNMLKLTRSLFSYNQDAKYMDYYERTLYNHLLGTLDPTPGDGGTSYFTPLSPGEEKGYDSDWNTCCHGTGLETPTKYQDSIYFKSADKSTLYVNLYMASTLNWEEKGFKITQTGDYLTQQGTSITVDGEGQLDIKLRVPYWVQKGYTVKINGVEQNITATPGSYVTLSRNWSKGDKIDISMPFSFRLERTPDDPTKASIMYGPLVMVGKSDSTDWLTLTLDPTDISKSITTTNDPLTFITNGITLVPEYQAADFKYDAYFIIK